MISSPCRAALVTLCAALMASAAQAATIVIQPSSQDAFIQQDKPNRIAGSGPMNQRIRVKSATPTPQIRRGLVQFDLSSIPNSATINSATLEIHEDSGAQPARTHGVFRVNQSWLQSTVKWNNQPTGVVSPISTATVGTARVFRSFNVTADVQAFVNAPTSNHGWFVKDTSETVGNVEVSYNSKEESHIPDLPNKPKLTVNFTAPPCTTNADCADTNACTTGEVCLSGFCSVTSVVCNDSNACTDDICDPQAGCQFPLGECDDGFSCTADICDPMGGCTHTPSNAVCNTACHTGTCVADPDATNLDPVTGCFITSVASAGTMCPADGNVCTNDVCDGAGNCGVNNTAPCSDGDGCTNGDQCSGGSCAPGSPTVCTPLDACHVAGTCNPGTGLCSDPPAGAGTGCNDNDACTQTDQCNGSGTCVGGNPVVCTPLDACHVAGTCNPGTGICSNPPAGSGTGCNDNDACTQTDQCNGSGTCVGGNPVVCTPLDQCHVAGICNPGTGICSNPPASSGTGCNDADLCTGPDQCDGGGQCVGGNPVVCTPLDQCHVAGTCNPGTGVCSNPPSGSGTNCDDTDACTQTDQCDGAGTCVGANPIVCTALDQCHEVGICNPGTGVCSDPPSLNTKPCDDSNACTQTDLCDGAGSCAGGNPVVCTPLDDCHVAGTCDTQTAICSNPLATDGTSCSDGNACTLGDSCTGGQCFGTPTTCGNGTVEPACNEDCDAPGDPSANCTAQCRFLCGPTPQAGCRQPVLPNKALVVLKNKTPDKRDVVIWKWIKGSATVLADFGTPLTTTGYTFCVYDSSANPQPLLLSMAPAGGTCAGKPCWKTTKTGFKYRDKELTPDGLSFLLEKAGADKIAKVIVKGKGVNLAMTPLPLTPAVTVQLKRNDNPSLCWSATYSTPIKNLSDQFKAKAD